VTGRKADFWLVGVLVTSVGVALLAAERRNRITPEIELLALASAGALGVVESYFAARRRISRIYLLDALMEAGFVAWWSSQWRPLKEPDRFG
jgi:hypothetical protein